MTRRENGQLARVFAIIAQYLRDLIIRLIEMLRDLFRPRVPPTGGAGGGGIWPTGRRRRALKRRRPAEAGACPNAAPQEQPRRRFLLWYACLPSRHPDCPTVGQFRWHA
jgi:hypothetical protein